MRSFDPRLVGELECETWVSYYRHEWHTFLAAAIRVVRHAFGLSWPRTVAGAWWVLRANQVWAPYPDNDPARARHFMRRFYALLARTHDEAFDVDEAARLEVGWWRVHRAVQRGHGPPSAEAVEELVTALQALYAHTYRVSPDAVRLAAEQRVEAMRLSDRWVRAGADRNSPLVRDERAALVRSYAALLAAVQTP
jgi:hypothetical protein